MNLGHRGYYKRPRITDPEELKKILLNQRGIIISENANKFVVMYYSEEKLPSGEESRVLVDKSYDKIAVLSPEVKEYISSEEYKKWLDEEIFNKYNEEGFNSLGFNKYGKTSRGEDKSYRGRTRGENPRIFYIDARGNLFAQNPTMRYNFGVYRPRKINPFTGEVVEKKKETDEVGDDNDAR